MTVFYVVISGAGDVLRTGHCANEDAGLQGETVLVFDEDPGVTTLSHRFNRPTGKLVSRDPNDPAPD